MKIKRLLLKIILGLSFYLIIALSVYIFHLNLLINLLINLLDFYFDLTKQNIIDSSFNESNDSKELLIFFLIVTCFFTFLTYNNFVDFSNLELKFEKVELELKKLELLHLENNLNYLEFKSLL